MFVNELRLYAEYLKKEIGQAYRLRGVSRSGSISVHSGRTCWRESLTTGHYYRRLVEESEQYRERMRLELLEVEEWLMSTAVQLIPQEA